MKKVKWIWLVPTALALVCAFLLPRLLMYLEQRKALSQIEAYDSPNSALNYGELTIAQKLSILANGNYSVIVDQSEGLPAEQETIDAFYAEMETLFAHGAIEEMYFVAKSCYDEGTNVMPFLAVDQIGNIAFRYYEVYSNNGSVYAIFDSEEKKILRLAYMGDVSTTVNVILVKNTYAAQDSESVGGTLKEKLSAWADYFGMLAQDVFATEAQGEADYYDKEEFYLAHCRLYDSNGNGVTFALCYQNTYAIEFSGIPDSVSAALDDAAASMEQDDEN